MKEIKNNVIPIRNLEQLGFDFNKKEIATIGKMEKELKEKQDWFITYAEEEWLKHYHVMKLLASRVPSPSLVTSYSDMPKAPRGGFYSATEDLAMESLEASEWLEYFHSKIDLLPETHRKIIEFKFLKRNRIDGRFERDDFVYQEIHLGRTVYYTMKTEALYWLGLALVQGIDKKKHVREYGEL